MTTMVPMIGCSSRPRWTQRRIVTAGARGRQIQSGGRSETERGVRGRAVERAGDPVLERAAAVRRRLAPALGLRLVGLDDDALIARGQRPAGGAQAPVQLLPRPPRRRPRRRARRSGRRRPHGPHLGVVAEAHVGAAAGGREAARDGRVPAERRVVERRSRTGVAVEAPVAGRGRTRPSRPAPSISRRRRSTARRRAGATPRTTATGRGHPGRGALDGCGGLRVGGTTAMADSCTGSGRGPVGVWAGACRGERGVPHKTRP